MDNNQIFGMGQQAQTISDKENTKAIVFENIYKVECFDKDGNLKWEEEIHNLVTSAGLDDVLDVYFLNGTQKTSWYVGLKNAGTEVAGDTMSSHGTWVENENYSESSRPDLTLAAVSGQSTDNSANKASFSIDTDTQTIAGCFVTSDGTKGGTTGTLYGVGDFSAAKSVDNGDTLNVTVTLTAASA